MNIYLLLRFVFCDRNESDTIERTCWVVTDIEITQYRINEGNGDEFHVVFNEYNNIFEDLKEFEHQKGFIMPFIYKIQVLAMENTNRNSLTLDFLDSQGSVRFSSKHENLDSPEDKYSIIITDGNDLRIKPTRTVLYIHEISVSPFIVGSKKEISDKLDLIVKYSSFLWMNNKFINNSDKNEFESTCMMSKFAFNKEVSKFDKILSQCFNETINVLMSHLEYTRMCKVEGLPIQEPFEHNSSLDLTLKRRIYEKSVFKLMSDIVNLKITTSNVPRKNSDNDSLDWLISKVNQMVKKHREFNDETLDITKINISEADVKKVNATNMKYALIIFAELSLKLQCKKIFDLNDTFFKFISKKDVKVQEEESKNDDMPGNDLKNSQRIPINLDDFEVHDMSEKKYFTFLLCTFHLDNISMVNNLKKLRHYTFGSKLTTTEIIFRLEELEKIVQNSINHVGYIRKLAVKPYDIFILDFLIYELRKDLEKCKAAYKMFVDKKVLFEEAFVKTINDMINKLLEKEERFHKTQKDPNVSGSGTFKDHDKHNNAHKGSTFNTHDSGRSGANNKPNGTYGNYSSGHTYGKHHGGNYSTSGGISSGGTRYGRTASKNDSDNTAGSNSRSGYPYGSRGTFGNYGSSRTSTNSNPNGTIDLKYSNHYGYGGPENSNRYRVKRSYGGSDPNSRKEGSGYKGVNQNIKLFVLILISLLLYLFYLYKKGVFC